MSKSDSTLREALSPNGAFQGKEMRFKDSYTKAEFSEILTDLFGLLDEATDAIEVAAFDPEFLETEDYKGLLNMRDLIEVLERGLREDVDSDSFGRDEYDGDTFDSAEIRSADTYGGDSL